MAKPKIDPRQCRCLTVDGHQCRNRALLGEKFCTFHKQHRRPVCPQKDAVDMPLLEDLSAIRLVISQVAHGLFTETIDPRYAGKILYACQVAAMTVPRPAPVKTEPVKDSGPVDETFTDTNGELLGPDRPWIGVNGRFEPTWSRDKMLYENQCELLGKPKPTCPADMPPEGWLTPDEQAEDHWTWPNRWMIRILERRIQKDQAGNLPPLKNRPCSYDNQHCRGPVKQTAHVVCEYCEWEGEAHQRIARGEQDPVPPKVRELCAREGIRLHIFGNDPANETDGTGDAEHSSGSSESTRPLRPKDGLNGAPARGRAGDSYTGAYVFVDEPEETEILDPQKCVFLNMRQCADDVGTLPPLEQRTCYYNMPDCAGPAGANPCTYCRRERDYYHKLRRGKGLDLNASAYEPQQSGCPVSPGFGEMGKRASARSRTTGKLACGGGGCRRRCEHRSRLAPAPVVNPVNTGKPHIPRAPGNRQLYRGGTPHNRSQHPCDILSGTILMASLQEYRCEVCGTVTNLPKGWWVIQCGDVQLTVLRWSADAANAQGARHYCGESHAQVYISRWFDSICTPGKPDFSGARSGRD